MTGLLFLPPIIFWRGKYPYKVAPKIKTISHPFRLFVKIQLSIYFGFICTQETDTILRLITKCNH